jgi:hypothetical protein
MLDDPEDDLEATTEVLAESARRRAEEEARTELALKNLSWADKHALAFASLAINCLPLDLRAASDADDMEKMLAGSPCGRDGFILNRARRIRNGFAWPVDRIGEEIYADMQEHIDDLVARALQRRERTMKEAMANHYGLPHPSPVRPVN